ncbi:MAG: hypothetical protein R3E88_04565 [Myxococcota bacterium]
MSDAIAPAGARCPFIARCPMFPLFESQHVLRIYQIQFCESKFERCMRHQKASRGVMPPANLLPDGQTLTSRD